MGGRLVPAAILVAVVMASVCAPAQDGEQCRVIFLVSPDGTRLAYGTLDHEENGQAITRVMVCTVDGSDRREIGTVLDHPDDVLWLGSDTLACTAAERRFYDVIGLDGETRPILEVPLFSSTRGDCSPKRLSPHGDQIAFSGRYSMGGPTVHFTGETKHGTGTDPVRRCCRRWPATPHIMRCAARW